MGSFVSQKYFGEQKRCYLALSWHASRKGGGSLPALLAPRYSISCPIHGHGERLPAQPDHYCRMRYSPETNIRVLQNNNLPVVVHLDELNRSENTEQNLCNSHRGMGLRSSARGLTYLGILQAENEAFASGWIAKFVDAPFSSGASHVH